MKLKIICIRDTDYHKIGDIIEAKIMNGNFIIKIDHSMSYGPASGSYITLAEYRNKQINSIFYDDFEG